MKGVILAAGIGSRLRPMTDNKPKCLVTVANKPMLAYQLDAYRMAGIRDIVIIVGYKGEQIEKYCRYIDDLNIKIVYNEEYEETNNMYSLYLAREHLDGKPFILNNADLVIESDIVSNMMNCEKPNLVAVDVNLFNEESMKVTCDNEGYIRDISKQIAQDSSNGCSIDFYKISSEISSILFAHIKNVIESGNRKDWTEVALQKIFKQPNVHFEILNVAGKKWVEVDNNDDLSLADCYFSQLKKKVSEYECYLFDLDGTLYSGDLVIDNAIQSVKDLQSQGKITKFLSNNSSKSKADYVDKLTGLGLKCTELDIVLSTDASIQFLKNHKLNRIYVLGTQKLQQVFIEEGFLIDDNNAEIIVVGYDTELNYQKLVTACRLINQGVDYIATHKDIFCPTEYGPIPDIGTLINMLKLTTGVQPLKIFGKPDISMVDCVAKKLGYKKSDILMVGDRLYTDIVMANDFGIDSVLVLSGDTTRDMVEDAEIKATYVLKNFEIKS